MATFTPGPFIGRISGNVGGVNFVQGKNGPFIRQRLQRVKHNTQEQRKMRAVFQGLVHNWSTISPEWREAWNRAAEFLKNHNRVGTSYSRTGFSLFMEHNLILGVAGLYDPDTSPFLTTTPSAEDVSVDASEGGTVEVNWTQPAPGYNFFQYIYGARSMSSRPKTHFGTWRFLTNILLGPGARNWDITADFNDALGPPYEGELIAVRMRPFRFDHLPGFQVQAQTVTVA